MKSYSDKELIVELLQFMRSSGRKEMLLKEYIRITNPRIRWTKRRVQALHKAIHATKAISIDYVPLRIPTENPDTEETTTIQCIRVRRTEVQHLKKRGETMPTKKNRRSIAFSGETEVEMKWLLENERQRRKENKEKGQFHESHLLAQLIHNEVELRRAFRF